MQALSPSFVPTFLQPLVEQFANRSTFTDRTLIPDQLEKQLPEYQYTPYTTELAKKIGGLIASIPGWRDLSLDSGGVSGPVARATTSPILIENYIKSWTGGMGMYALEAADAALRKQGALPDPITPTPDLADIPFIRAFAVRYPSASAQSIQDFYDGYQKNKTFFDTWMAKAREGDSAAMEHIQSIGGPQIFAQLDAVRETLSEHSKLIRDIYRNREIDANQKRQLIDTLYTNMIAVGRAGKDMLRQIGATAQ